MILKEGHCQICERKIKCASGVCAHHGYERPERGSGYQTESCIGARYRPYEISRERIPYAISMTKLRLDSAREWRLKLNSFPELFRDEYVLDAEGKRVKDAKGQDKVKRVGYKQGDEPYMKLHAYHVNDADRDVANWERELKRLQARYDNWVEVVA